MKKTSEMSNGEFLKYLDEYAHPLAGVFAIDAIMKSCTDVIANQEENKRLREKRSIIAPDAWINCAKDLKKELTNRHK